MRRISLLDRDHTRGMKRALALERQKEAELAEQLTPSELLAINISRDRESWLDRTNIENQINS